MADDKLNSQSFFNEGLNKDLGDIFSKNSSLKYARNAILYSETGDFGYISNEPSNELCVSIEYDGGKPQIIGAIFLFDDYWAIFSTLNDQPTDGKNSEIGIFDYSRCVYIPVVRSTCLNFSPLYPIKGISRFANDGIKIYWADGYNDDRYLDLGLPEAWYKTPAERGDPTITPWLGSFEIVPYLWYDETSDDCIVKKYCQPLKLNCEALRLIPSFNPIVVTCKQSDKGGSLPNGLYYAAVAYSIKGQRYSNYFISPVAHLFSTNNANSLTIKIMEVDERVFDEIEVSIISQVNNQLSAKVLGYYPITTKQIDVTFVEPTLPVMDPTDVFRNKPVAVTSDGIYQLNDYAVRVGPHIKLDFNYQPLANLIKVEFGVVEYPANYYEKVNKNSFTSIYSVDADAVSFMRDEVYTFYIRWVYDTGDRSPMFHIPAPPIKEQQHCDCGDGVNDVKFTKRDLMLNNGGNQIVQDGGKLLYYGTVGTFLSSERYDCSRPERWNFSWFKNNVIANSKYCKTEFKLPYRNTTESDYDLCCTPIRLVHIPSEQDYPELKLYNNSNDTIRYVGLRFSNIYHPLDNQGKPIENIVGYEILRASREGNKTIVAKGILERTIKYDAVNEKQQSNKNRLFANFPYDPFDDKELHNWITIEKTPTQYVVDNHLRVFLDSSLGSYSNFNMTLPAYDRADDMNKLFKIEFDKYHYVFRSPETSFGKPYANWDKLRIYGELYGSIKHAEYFVPELFPRYKVISPMAYFMLNIRGVAETSIKLNGKIKIRFESQEIGLNGNAISSDAFGVGATMNVVMVVLAIYIGLSYQTFINALTMLYSNPTFMLAMNSYGMTPTSANLWVQQQIAGTTMLMALLGGGKFKPPVPDIEPGLFDQYPRQFMLLTYIPLFLATLSQTVNDLEEIFKASVPFHDYALQIATHGFYDKFFNTNYDCAKIKDSVYIGRNIHMYNSLYINNLYRTPYVLVNTSKDLTNKVNKDHSNDLRVYGNCCGFPPITPETSLYENLKSCGERVTNLGKTISAKYVSLKVSNERPYGQLFENKAILMGNTISIVKEKCTDLHDSDCRCNYNNYIPDKTLCGKRYTSPWMLYGDVYVTRYTEKDTFLFFYDFPFNQPDNFDYDFLKRRNILYPRFWLSTQRDDLITIMNDKLDKYCATCTPTLTDLNNSLCNYDPNCQSGISSFLNDLIGLSMQDGQYNASNGPYSFSGNTLLQFICKVNEKMSEITNGITTGVIESINGAMNMIRSLIGSSLGHLSAPGDCRGFIRCIGAFIEAIWGFFVAIFTIIVIAFTIIMAFIGIIVSFASQLLANTINAVFLLPLLSGALIRLLVNTKYNPRNALINRLLIPYNLDGCMSHRCVDPSSNNRKRIFAFGYFGMWFYIGISSVRDFYVESEYNMAFRLDGDEPYTVYYSVFKNSNLLTHFNIKNLKAGDSFLYDTTLMASRQFIGYASHGFMQPRHYNPKIQDYLAGENKFMLLYSLPFKRLAGLDGNRIYLPNNYVYYNDEITGLKNINDTGAIVLFKHSAPLYYAGVDTLKTDAGVKINLGDGMLFEQPERKVINADTFYQYGSCQSPFAMVNSPVGIFYISNTNGRIFQYTDGLKDLTLEAGISRWSQFYLRYRINEYVKDFPLLDNPIDGVGSNVVYDGRYNIIYFTKRDYDLKKQFKDKIDNGQMSIEFHIEYEQNLVKYYKVFVVKDGSGNIIDIFDFNSPRMLFYFDDVSVTLSYSPITGKFISYHDWVPDLAYGSNDGFFTINENEIWVHNKRCDSYCNFYGKQYPFELEFETDLGNNVTTIRSLEFNLEARKYSEDCNTYHHKLDYFFDRLIVYNSEQCSGYLDLIMQHKNNPIQNLQYPKITPIPSIEILWSKVEQKYRVNQFYDVVKDRGEYTGTEDIFLIIEPNGYVRKLDNSKLDYNKAFVEHKRFRHFVNNIWLIKDYRNNDNDKKIIVMLSNVKNQISFR